MALKSFKKITIIWIFLFLMTVFNENAFSLGGKDRKVPMKPYSEINIPDGEFIHYVNYLNGEKTQDTYIVAKKEIKENGDVLYRFYSDIITVTDSREFDKDYTKWPSYFLVDIKNGSIVEALEYVGHDVDKSNYVINYRYKLHRDKGYASYIIKSVKNDKLVENKYRVKVDTKFPSWDYLSLIYGVSFLDVKSGGIFYTVRADALKEALPCTFKFVDTKIIDTNAGSFRAHKGILVIADTFLGRLLEPVLESADIWIDDSDRRLLVKCQVAGNITVLKEVSNISLK